MSKTTERSFIKKALSSIANGDATGLKKNIREALLAKVRRALDIKEREIASSLVDNATKKKININEATVVVSSDIHTKGGKVVAKSGAKIQTSSKQDLATKLKMNTKDLFADDGHEKKFDAILAKGGTAYVYVDPYHYDINNIATLGVASSQKEADKQEKDSADEI